MRKYYLRIEASQAVRAAAYSLDTPTRHRYSACDSFGVCSMMWHIHACISRLGANPSKATKD
eukprot:scaffold207_cov409-Prasinococcus_capsulatus_cf.AAC.40